MNFRTASRPLKGSMLGMVLVFCFSASAQAQSPSGNIAGRATAGDVAVVTSQDTGFTRKVIVGDDGRYRIGSLPIGVYVVTLQHADGAVYLSQATSVHAGRTVRIK